MSIDEDGPAASVMAYLPSKDWLAIYGLKGDLRVFEKNRELPFALQTDIEQPFTAVAFSQGGQYMFIGNQKGTILMYNVETKRTTDIYLAFAAPVKRMEVTKDDKYLIMSAADGTLKILEWRTKKRLRDPALRKGRMACWDYHEGRDLLTMAFEDKMVQIYDLAKGVSQRTFASDTRFGEVKLSEDADYVIGISESVLVVVNIASRKETTRINLRE